MMRLNDQLRLGTTENDQFPSSWIGGILFNNDPSGGSIAQHDMAWHAVV